MNLRSRCRPPQMLSSRQKFSFRQTSGRPLGGPDDPLEKDRQQPRFLLVERALGVRLGRLSGGQELDRVLPAGVGEADPLAVRSRLDFDESVRREHVEVLVAGRCPVISTNRVISSELRPSPAPRTDRIA